jgi:NADH-quinone oxidoreductase subunit N
MFPTASRIDALQSIVGTNLVLFAPEVVLCFGIVALLAARLIAQLDRTHLGGLAIAILAIAACALALQLTDANEGAGPYFDGMLVSDLYVRLGRFLIVLAALLSAAATQFTGIPDARDSADYFVLLLGGTLGMLLMVSANHLLMAFIAVEMASLPSYVLAGFSKGKRTGSEAALKYVVYGAAASGIMLYGIALLSGLFGTGYLPDISAAIARRALDLPVLAGLSLLLVGLGFKLAAFPFQFWCPDVFEGAAAEVAGFLSVASKSAAVMLAARLAFTLQAHQSYAWTLPGSLGVALGAVAAATITFGNLAALGQTNLKRLLAYSSIAHAGYLLLAIATLSAAGAASIPYYLAAYIAMNLGAFAVVAIVRNATHSEELTAFRGLIERSPVLAIAMTVFLLSLLGLPPLAGFAGKFQIFAAVYDAARLALATGHSNLGTALYACFGLAALNTAIGAYYYLKVIRTMLLDSPDASAATKDSEIRIGSFASAYSIVLAIALLVGGIVWDPLASAADRAAAGFGLKR